jgi:type I restriction enzyme, S subunit
MTTKLNNSPKIFILNCSDLEGRLDTFFYDPEVTNKIKKISSIKHFKLGSKLKKIETGFNNKQNENCEGIKFIRTQNIRPIFLDVESASYTTDLKVRVPSIGSLLFTRIGVNVGDVSYNHLGNFAISDNIISAEFEESVFSNFVAIYLNTELGKLFINREKRDTARAIISYENIKNILIPDIDKSKQIQVINLINNAYTQKQQKEAQAKALLQSIDTYILETLGITIPEKQSGIEHRMFTTNFSDVVGLRFDPIFFNSTQKSHSDVYDNKTLKSVCKILKGQSITKEKITEGNYPVIAGGQSSPYNHGSYNYEGNVITISASGAYSGYVWYHNYPIFASDCIVLQSKNEEEQNTQFIYYVLKALQQEIYKLQQGAGQPHVYARDLEKFTIPIPAMPQQIEMLKHIDDLHHQINTLKADAIAVLENAKAEVEKIIIG